MKKLHLTVLAGGKVSAAKESGYDFIENSIYESDQPLDRLNWSKEERRELHNIIFNNDFNIVSMCLSSHRKYSLDSKNENKRKKAYKTLENTMKFVIDLGIRSIQLARYNVCYEENDIEIEKKIFKGLQYAATLAEKNNVMLSIEVMDTSFLGTVERFKNILVRLKALILKVM